MNYIDEVTIKEKYSLKALFLMIKDLYTQNGIFSGLYAEDTFAGLDLGVKGGCVSEEGFGIKVRAGKEGNYYTIVWDLNGEIIGVVNSSFLTYVRTASLLILYPYLKMENVQNILVLGFGLLGKTTVQLARLLYPHANILVWSRSQRYYPTGLENWDAKKSNTTSFDLVLTCTRASRPLPIHNVKTNYIGVGGAVNHKRKELPPFFLENVGALFSDDPNRAVKKCGDLERVSISDVKPLNKALQEISINGLVISFVCGTGSIDVALAFSLLKNAERKEILHGYS